MSYTTMLKHSVSVKRKTVTRDANGLASTTFANTHDALVCIVQAVSGSMTRKLEGQNIMATHMMFVPKGTDILEDDLVTSGGRVLRVTFVDHDAAGQAHHLEVYLAEPEHR